MDALGAVLISMLTSAGTCALIAVALKAWFDQRLEAYKSELKLLADKELERAKVDLRLQGDLQAKGHEGYARLSELLERTTYRTQRIRWDGETRALVGIDGPVLAELDAHVQDFEELVFQYRLYWDEAALLPAARSYLASLRLLVSLLAALSGDDPQRPPMEATETLRTVDFAQRRLERGRERLRSALGATLKAPPMAP